MAKTRRRGGGRITDALRRHDEQIKRLEEEMAHLIAEPGSNGAKRGDLATRITKHQMAYARLAKRLRTLRNFGGRRR
jgi:hypothetical protein